LVLHRTSFLGHSVCGRLRLLLDDNGSKAKRVRLLRSYRDFPSRMLPCWVVELTIAVEIINIISFIFVLTGLFDREDPIFAQ
jgi:hypothetical protein